MTASPSYRRMQTAYQSVLTDLFDSRTIVELAIAIGAILVSGSVALRQLFQASAGLATAQASRIDVLTARIAEVEAHSARLEKSNDDLSAQLHASNLAIAALTAKLKAAEGEIGVLRDERARLQNDLTLAVAEKNRLQSQLTDLAARVREVEKKSGTGPIHERGADRSPMSE